MHIHVYCGYFRGERQGGAVLQTENIRAPQRRGNSLELDFIIILEFTTFEPPPFWVIFFPHMKVLIMSLQGFDTFLSLNLECKSAL